jgi:hypothetical protein
MVDLIKVYPSGRTPAACAHSHLCSLLTAHCVAGCGPQPGQWVGTSLVGRRSCWALSTKRQPSMRYGLATTRVQSGVGAPVGLQLVARPGSEQLLLALAAHAQRPYQRSARAPADPTSRQHAARRVAAHRDGPGRV